MNSPLSHFHKIKVAVFDVDGVFTNSQMLITESGHLLRSMSTRDGWAIKQLLQSGIRVGIITGGNSEGVHSRLARLGIEDIFSGIRDKYTTFHEWARQKDIDVENTLYMGDDIPDIRVMESVGVACCPSDAVPEVIAVADYISNCKGGEGCVRDVVEKIMKIQGTWPL